MAQFAPRFVENKAADISVHGKGDRGVSAVLVTRLCCLDLHAEASQCTAELSAAWLCGHDTGLQE